MPFLSCELRVEHSSMPRQELSDSGRVPHLVSLLQTKGANAEFRTKTALGLNGMRGMGPSNQDLDLLTAT